MALLLLGVAGMLVLATGPVDVFGRSWQIHTMLGFVALTLIGAQVIQLGVFARTYARVRIGERDPLLERLGRGLSLERGLLVGGILVFLAVAGLFAIGAEWAARRVRHPRASLRDGAARDGPRARHPGHLRRVLPRAPDDAAAPRRADRRRRQVISVVIPVKDGGADLERCLTAIAAQEATEAVEVLVIDSGSSDGSAELARRMGARVEEIPAAEFGHGRTRNLGAELARGDVLVFTSQDAYAADTAWLESLVAPLRERPRVAGVYGRQLPHADATPPERYFLDFLYGSEPRVQRISGPDDLTMDATLFSNVNAAIPARDLGGVPVRRRPDHERGPGVVAASADGGLRARLRARGGGLPLAHVHDLDGVQALLRLGRVRRALVRERPFGVRRSTPGGSAVRAWGDRVAVANGQAALDPVRGRLRAREVQRASSSGAGIASCPRG